MPHLNALALEPLVSVVCLEGAQQGEQLGPGTRVLVAVAGAPQQLLGRGVQPAFWSKMSLRVEIDQNQKLLPKTRRSTSMLSLFVFAIMQIRSIVLALLFPLQYIYPL